MALAKRQRISLAVVAGVNAALWIVPSQVVEQIARDRHTMLGRYSRTHFAWIVGVFLVSLAAVYLITSTGEKYKRRWFQLIAALIVIAPSLVVADFLLHTPARRHYIREGVLHHHPPLAEFHRRFEDKPEAYRTYPNAKPGYGSVDCTLRTDRRGYRNRTDLDRYDVVVLGDSFAEGSGVSDEQAWPGFLAAESGLSVYNLGMSGYSPVQYLASLREIGLSLKPRFVVCLLFEGNDFRSSAKDADEALPSWSDRLGAYFKQSPLLGALDGAIIRTFGPINATGPVRGGEVLDWMPLSIPDGSRARHYAFAPKQLRDLYKSREEFAGSGKWLAVRYQLEGMRDACSQADCRLVVAYAPTAAHVLLPLVADRLSAEKVRAFTALDYDKKLPDAEEFWRNLRERLDARASVVRAWCAEQSLLFVDLSQPLRAAADGGTQVYYTYDQHWTPDGHAVVARTFVAILSERRSPASGQAAP